MKSFLAFFSNEDSAEFPTIYPMPKSSNVMLSDLPLSTTEVELRNLTNLHPKRLKRLLPPQNKPSSKATAPIKPIIVSLASFEYKTKKSTEKNHKCECGASFTCRSHLETHKRIHTKEKTFSCKTCNALFRRNCDLLRHNNTHTMEKIFTCEQCHKPFSRKDNLRKHMLSHPKSALKE